VLVTGFGRFGHNAVNASGQVVAALLGELDYPLTEPPEPGAVDDPAPQTRAALGQVVLPASGPVQICAMVLPVYWDLAALLVLEEIAAFRPQLVLMNGIAGSVQPLWIELGSVNRAMGAPDGSGALEPVEGSPLVVSAPPEEMLRGLYLSWSSVRRAAERAIDERAADAEGDVPLTDVLPGVLFAGFPRWSNTYLCNNTTYTVGYLMDHPGETVRLLVPSTPREGYPSGVDARLDDDFSEAPRVFVHWPSQLGGLHVISAATVLQAMIDAQLQALQGGDDPPTRGDNALADIAPSP
jgi:pyrrolidone-carboxylate peptidase